MIKQETDDHRQLIDYLLAQGLIRNTPVHIYPLQGGVSSDILLVRQGQKQFVVKKALAKLRVAAEWYADVSRNNSEQAYMSYVQQFQPGVVPNILHRDPAQGLFIMEYLGDGFTNWKTELLRQQIRTTDVRKAASILGSIHSHSWAQAEVANVFKTDQNFYELRLEPYLLTTAQKHPKLKPLFEQESNRLAQTHQCLVHGDYSPKNILLHQDRMVILDCEVAWYGDPSFDLAFLMNHFFLKAIHFTPNHQPFIAGILQIRDAYRQAMGQQYEQEQLEARVCHLLPMLLLARIDGKSPVEYLKSEAKKALIRRFVQQELPRKANNLNTLLQGWKVALDRFST